MYTKAYTRRATANEKLDHLESALEGVRYLCIFPFDCLRSTLISTSATSFLLRNPQFLVQTTKKS